MTQMMRSLVKVQSDFKPSVQLPGDFFNSDDNRHFINNYIPTQEMLDIFMDIRDSLQPNADQRARLFSGTYGTGKSDLMLLIANYVTRSADDPLLASFFKRLYLLDHAKADAIYKAKLGKAPFLLVLLQPRGASTFSSFLLNGLANSLRKEGLEHFLGKTYYQAALDLIDKWEKELPNNLKRFEQFIVNDYNLTLNGLKRDLGGPDADTAMGIFRPVFEKVTGVPFNPGDVIQEPDQAINAVVKKLVDSGKYSGIFTIIDEFTQLLNKLGKSPDGADSKAIDKVAALATRSRQNQFHFFIVSLYPFTQIPTETEEARVVIESTGGRFSNISLRSQNTEELIRGSIEKLQPIKPLFEKVQGQYDDLLNLSMRLWGEAPLGQDKRDWLREIVIEGCFPLHPLATYCLPKLNARLAQNERTMFSFILDTDRGLGHFIQEATGEAKDGWFSLLSVDRLFNYFEANLEQKREDLHMAYQESSLELPATQVESGLEGRLLRALVILEVAAVQADRDLLRHALGLPSTRISDINNALSQLEDVGAVYLSQSGYYQLIKPGRANPKELRRLIDQRARTILQSPLETLNAQYKPDNVEATRYNSKRGSWRELSSHYVSLAGLSSPATLTQALKENDGLLWYVVSTSETELEKACSTARQITKTKEQLVVAVPRSPTNILSRLKGKHALDALRNSPDYQTAEYTDMLIDTGLVGRGYVVAFQEALQWFKKPVNFLWYQGGSEVTVTTTAHLSDLASKVMDKVFFNTPAHKISQHLKPGGRASAPVNKAIEQILKPSIRLEANKKKRSSDEIVLLQGAGELGLVKYIDRKDGFDIYKVCAPARRAVWDLIDEQLQQGVAWSDIVNQLQAPPYGLYPSVLQLFTAAFYRLNRDYFEVFEVTKMGERPIEVTSEQIKTLVTKPDQYLLRYQPLTEPQRSFLRSLSENVLELKIYSYRGETASLRNRVAKRLREWAEQIPKFAKQSSTDELGEILENVPSEILSAAVDLMETASLSDDAETASALLDTLPGHLGLPADSSTWTDTEQRSALARLETAGQQLSRFQTIFKKHMVNQIGQCFEQTQPIEKADQVLGAAQSWRCGRVKVVHSADLSDVSDARDLLYVLEGSPASFEDAFLNELMTLWKLPSFDKWESIAERDKYLQRLRQAKADTEAKAIELGLSSEQRDLAGKQLLILFNRQVIDTSDNTLAYTLTEELRKFKKRQTEVIQSLKQCGLSIKSIDGSLVDEILKEQEQIEQLRTFLSGYKKLVALNEYHTVLTNFIQAGHPSTYKLALNLINTVENVQQIMPSLYEGELHAPLVNMKQIIDEQEVVEKWDSFFNHYQTLLKAYQLVYANLHRQRSEVYRQLQEKLTRYGVGANLSEYVVEVSSGWTEDGLRYAGGTADLVELRHHLQAAEKIEEDALRPIYQQTLTLVDAVKQAVPPLEESLFQPHLEDVNCIIEEQQWVAQWEAYHAAYQKLLKAYQTSYADLHRRRDEAYRKIRDRVAQFGAVPAVVTERIAKSDIGSWTENGLRYAGEKATLVELHHHLQSAEKIEEDALRPIYQQTLTLVDAVKQAVPPLEESLFQPHLEDVNCIIEEQQWVAQWEAYHAAYQKLLKAYQTSYADLHRRRDEAYRKIRDRVAQFGAVPAVVTERIAKSDIGTWTEDGLRYAGEKATLVELYHHLQAAENIEEDALRPIYQETLPLVDAVKQAVPPLEESLFQPHLEDVNRIIERQQWVAQWEAYHAAYQKLLKAYQTNYADLHRRRDEAYRRIRDQVAQFGVVPAVVTERIAQSDIGTWTEDGLRYAGETTTLVELHHHLQAAEKIEEDALNAVRAKEKVKALAQAIEDISQIPVSEREQHSELKSLIQAVSELPVIENQHIHFDNYQTLLGNYQEAYKKLYKRRSEIYRRMRDEIVQFGEVPEHITELIVESEGDNWHETGICYAHEVDTLIDLYRQIQSAPTIKQQVIIEFAEKQNVLENAFSKIKSILDNLSSEEDRSELLKLLIEEYGLQ